MPYAFGDILYVWVQVVQVPEKAEISRKGRTDLQKSRLINSRP